MKAKKEKISAKTTLQYVHIPDQALIRLVNSYFELEADNLDGQANIKMIRKTYDIPREIYALNFRKEVYYIKKYYPLTLKQKLKYLSLKLQRLSNFLLSPRLTAISFNTSKPLFMLTKHKGFFNHERIIVINKA